MAPLAARPAGGASAGMLSRQWRAPFPLDLVRTLAVHRRGMGDPAFQADVSGAVWRTCLTPDGPATLRVTAVPGPGPGGAGAGHRPGQVTPRAATAAPPAATGREPGAATDVTVSASAWGPGASWLLAALPAMLGAADDPAGFQPAHRLLRQLTLRHRGVRVGRSGRVLEALVPAVLEQKVVGAEASRAWRLLMLEFGDPAPGPAPPGMRVFPSPRAWLGIASWEWHRAGVEGIRARTITAAAAVAGRLEEIVAMPPAEADRRLRALPGIGPWTSAEVRQRACGDTDAVSVGDYHLPAAVGWVLAGRKVDDTGMLELLAPYAGHRYRVTRLVELSGIRPPRHGPRLAPRDYRAL